MEILLDMDGVLCDFYTAALDACDLPRDTKPEWDFWLPYMTTEEFWQKIDDRTYFWEDLEPYPWMHELVDACKSLGRVWFCSTPGPDRDSASGKLAWLRRHKLLDSNYVLTPHKHMLSKPGRVLIDDSIHNVTEFVRSSQGSGALLFPQPWSDYGLGTQPTPSSVLQSLRGRRVSDDEGVSVEKSGLGCFNTLLVDSLRGC